MIDAVVINFKRPQNIPLIVTALRSQTVPVRVVLVDAAEQPIDTDCDVYIRLKNNYGPWNRYAGSLLTQAEYTYFHDDDMLPGPKVIENFMNYSYLPFAVMGQEGRIWDQGIYNFNRIISKQHPLVVDHLVRGYFIKTENLKYLIQVREKVEPLDYSDDMWLCKSIARLGSLTNYVVPAIDEQKMDLKELCADGACCSEPNWGEKRTQTICKIASTLGYRPIEKTRLTIVTPVSRPQNLPMVKESLELLKPYFNIKWVLALDEKFAKPEDVTVEADVIISAPHTPGGDNQRNAAFPFIEEGWVYYVDDDNVIHPHFGPLAKHYIDTSGKRCIIFSQLYPNGEPRNDTTAVELFKIDTASFVLHSSVIQKATWRPYPGKEHWVDFMFINDVWQQYPEEFLFTRKWCAYHNYLRPE